ncbi:MAG TPA: flavohemoglobin expression-modulating QEGLA motif protein, partial [Tahibacter sp.]|nr:flavohemoglobin expression-modulating QEGLA motif protein [Tahibacter sp.]
TDHSIRLYGRPGDKLAGAQLTNLDAARHFIDLAGELDQELSTSDADYCIPAEVLRAELQQQLDAFFHSHKVEVEIDPDLIAKAAAGPTRIRLRSATCFSEYDRHQLIEHEAFVHSLTGLNGREQPNLKSLSRSSPRVTATQEGLAVFAELMSGSIDIERMKRISLRIVAIHMALAGADFIEVFRFFLESGQTEADSFSSAQRVFRGVPVTGGAAFTKDNVYLHGLMTVHTFFRWALKHRRLSLCSALFAGKMTLHDVIALEPYFASGYIAQPMYLPPWARRGNGLAGMLAFSLFANHIRMARVEAEDLVLGL